MLIKRHWIAKIFVRICNTAAVKTDEFGIFCQLFYFFEHILACQHAEMALMVTTANSFLHNCLLPEYLV